MLYGNVIAAGMIILFAVYIFISSFMLNSDVGAALGPGFMPRIMGITLFVLGVLDFIKEIKILKDKKVIHSKVIYKDYKDWIVKHIDICSCVVLLLYVFTIKPLGFLLSSAIYMFIHMLLLTINKKRNYLAIMLLTIIVPTLVYYCFTKIFYLMLPPGVLG